MALIINLRAWPEGRISIALMLSSSGLKAITSPAVIREIDVQYSSVRWLLNLPGFLQNCLSESIQAIVLAFSLNPDPQDALGKAVSCKLS